MVGLLGMAGLVVGLVVGRVSSTKAVSPEPEWLDHLRWELQQR